MHFVLTPVGSSGDVNPFLGIGGELQARGHRVTLLTSEPFREAAETLGLNFVSSLSREAYDQATRHPDLWHPRRGLNLLLEVIGTVMRENYESVEALYEPGGTVLVGHMLSLGTRVFEEKFNVPAVTLQLAPSAFRSDYQQAATPSGRDLSNLPVWLKRSLWWVVDRLLIDPRIVPKLNRWRSDLGLEPVKRLFRSWVHSPGGMLGLFPDWFAQPQPDWPPQLRLTGFPLFDDVREEACGQGLMKFLQADDSPVVFTPGTANRQAKAFFQAAIEATRLLGRRALLLTPFREQLPEELPDHVEQVSYAPFSRLLPKCGTVVHHGGIGTCAQGLAAGIPQLVMPMAFDQPDNAVRLQRLGVASWITPGRFTGARLARHLDRLSGKAVAASCRHYRQLLEAHQPIQQACNAIEEFTLS